MIDSLRVTLPARPGGRSGEPRSAWSHASFCSGPGAGLRPASRKAEVVRRKLETYLVPRQGKSDLLPSYVFRRRLFESYLDAVDGRKASLPGRLGETHGSIEPIVIGHGQRLITQLDSSFHQILGVGGPVEKGEVGVAMQLGISISHSRTISNIRSVWSRPDAKFGRSASVLDCL